MKVLILLIRIFQLTIYKLLNYIIYIFIYKFNEPGCKPGINPVGC